MTVLFGRDNKESDERAVHNRNVREQIGAVAQVTRRLKMAFATSLSRKQIDTNDLRHEKK